MPKKISTLSILLIAGYWLLVTGVVASNISDFTNHEAPEAYFYPSEFDKLVLDVTIPPGESGQTDTLNAITVASSGTARVIRDIDKVKIWADAGQGGFQGMGIDDELGEATWYSAGSYWYFSGLSKEVPAEGGLRIFVSVETKRSPTANTTIKMELSAFLDNDADNEFDLGDTGVFMASKKNGPIGGAVKNTASQTIKTSNTDKLAPRTVVIDPKAGAKIASTSYTIKGESRDQGGSTPEWVKISIAKSGGTDNWQDVKATGSNYATWEYEWISISDGTYVIKTKSKDWIGNSEIAHGITVTVDTTPEVEAEPEPTPTPEPEPKFKSGDLIKASTTAVYYYGADAKRYVFVNDKVFKTWYTDFSSVKTITGDELAAITIGGNVTYRPGVKMVKITTDPKTYAVDKGGILRWVKTESIAKELYGDNWNTMIDDVPDAFFVNYTVGDPIEQASDYSPSATKTASLDINTDKGI